MDVDPRSTPTSPFERLQLDDTSWIDIARGWLIGADAVYDAPRVDASRGARVGCGATSATSTSPAWARAVRSRNPGHPVLADAQQRDRQASTSARFDGFGLAYYRNSRDSVAMHRDREMRWLDDTVVAILTFGAQRPFLVQRRNTRDRRPAATSRPRAAT